MPAALEVWQRDLLYFLLVDRCASAFLLILNWAVCTFQVYKGPVPFLRLWEQEDDLQNYSELNVRVRGELFPYVYQSERWVGLRPLGS